MKFKIELDIEDFLNDLLEDAGEGYITSIKDSLLFEIRRDVVSQISLSIKDQVKKEITEKVLNEVNNTVSVRISNYIEDFIQKEILYEGTANQITIKEMVERNFTNTRYWDNLLPAIKKVGETFGEQIKKRYDIEFASAILLNMKENDLLSSDALKALFKDK